LLLSEFPRVVIYCVVLFDYFFQRQKAGEPMFSELMNPGASMIKVLGLYALLITTMLFFATLFTMFIAALLYVPLILHIQGNLKEYCCHKIDKRITAIIANSEKDIQEKARRDEIHLKNQAGDMTKYELLRPQKPRMYSQSAQGSRGSVPDVAPTRFEYNRPAYPSNEAYFYDRHYQ
jgi:hypothetical protein